MVKNLTQKSIKTHLDSLDSDWELNSKGTAISREFHFGTYIEGLIFINRLAVHAEVLDHHPEVTMKFGLVKVLLTTQSIKSLSAQDFELAKHADTIFTLSTENKRRRSQGR
jgi:4a-hydroxytetrahydrobiopterin dehydratase